MTGSTKHAKSVTNEDHLDGALAEASKTNSAQHGVEGDVHVPEETPAAAPVVAREAPRSWADLVRTKAPINASPVNSDRKDHLANGFGGSQAVTLSEALATFDLREAITDTKVSFLKPRGLVNTGNMCYMNSVCSFRPGFSCASYRMLMVSKVLQVLVSCVPFYAFLREVARQAVHSFNSQTPMLDAM